MGVRVGVCVAVDVGGREVGVIVGEGVEVAGCIGLRQPVSKRDSKIDAVTLDMS